MNENNNQNNIFNKFRNFIFINSKKLIATAAVLILTVICIQVFNYFNVLKVQKNSIKFFDIIENENNNLNGLDKLSENEDIYGLLSKLKLIQKNNEEKNYSFSNQIYKEIINSKNLEDIYKNSISVHAAYTLIGASYFKNTTSFLNDISIYIKNINDDLDGYISIKNELEFLLLVTELELNKSDYNNNKKVLDKYNDILNSNSISSSVKERVKKIHEFQQYK